MEIKYVTIQELKDLLQTKPDDFTPWATKEFVYFFDTQNS